jgi:guanyl-specific ribonuclease Sa
MLACSHSMKFGAAIAGAAIILGGTSVDGARSTLRSSRQGSLSALGAAQARTTKGVPADVAKQVPAAKVGRLMLADEARELLEAIEGEGGAKNNRCASNALVRPHLGVSP